MTTDPRGIKTRESFQMRLVDRRTNREVAGKDVSTGEATIMRLFMLMFALESYREKPSLLLLDDPDAHLHASLIPVFMRALQNVFVNGLGSRVIMTTHRTETVSFAPPDSLFIMRAVGPRVAKCTARETAISLLTGNLVAMVNEERPVFVEDRDDQDFFHSTLSILRQQGGWRQGAYPSFLEAGAGSGSKRIPGGMSVTRNMVRRLHDAGLYMVQGVIDRDAGNVGSPGIRVLDRHSMENYLFDPLVIACALLDAGYRLPTEGCVQLSVGDEHRLRSMTDNECVAIAEKMLEKLEIYVGDRDRSRHEVLYTFGGRSVIPAWLRDIRGHDLEKACAITWPKVVAKKNMLRAYERAQMVPETLRNVLEATVSL